MGKIHLIITPEQAERMADALNHAVLASEHADEVRELAEQAARLNHLAAKARARAARAGTD